MTYLFSHPCLLGFLLSAENIYFRKINAQERKIYFSIYSNDFKDEAYNLIKKVNFLNLSNY
jgi:hypothetical protein